MIRVKIRARDLGGGLICYIVVEAFMQFSSRFMQYWNEPCIGNTSLVRMQNEKELEDRNLNLFFCFIIFSIGVC
jgi:hypothetical protein